MKFEADPDYEKIKGYLNSALNKYGLVDDSIYEWNTYSPSPSVQNPYIEREKAEQIIMYIMKNTKGNRKPSNLLEVATPRESNS